MLVKARAKAEAIQLLAAALAQQVSHGSLGQPLFCCWAGRTTAGTWLSLGHFKTSKQGVCCPGDHDKPGVWV